MYGKLLGGLGLGRRRGGSRGGGRGGRVLGGGVPRGRGGFEEFEGFLLEGVETPGGELDDIGPGGVLHVEEVVVGLAGGELVGFPVLEGDLGPEGGDKGGEILFEGVPGDLPSCKKSYTGKFLVQKVHQ